MNKTAIIILTYNNLNYNKGCLETIRKYTKLGEYEIVIVDNGSTDGTREWLKMQHDIKLVLNNENVGFPKGCNIGIREADPNSDIMLLNNDVEVCSNWLENMKTALYSDEKIGAVGAATSYDFVGAINGTGEVINFDNNNMEEIHEFADRNNVLNPNRWKYKNGLIGFCMLIKRSVLDKIGLLDERFTPGTFEDDDISYRIILSGYKLMVCYDSYIHHFGSKSFNHKTAEYWQLIHRNSMKFSEKWGFESDDKYKIRKDLVNMIEEKLDREMNVLQIDPGLGGALLDILNKYPKAKLYGIENNEKYIPIVKNIVNLSTKKIGNFPLEFQENFFDYVIIGSNIERVENPRDFLIQLKKYLKDEGQIILSIQNVMHYSVVRELLKGNWSYGESKVLLNKDNSIFLTLDDFNKFIFDCGYTNLFTLYWYQIINYEDEAYIKELCSIFGEEKEYLYKTYQYTVRLGKG